MAGELKLQVGVADKGQGESLAAELQQDGIEAELEETQHGFLPLPFLLAVAIPPGLALLAQTIHKILGERGPGVIIDASGEGIKIYESDAAPGRSVTVIAGEDEEHTQTELSGPDVATYATGTIGALAGGAKSADEAAKAGKKAVDSKKPDGAADAGGADAGGGGTATGDA